MRGAYSRILLESKNGILGCRLISDRTLCISIILVRSIKDETVAVSGRNL